MKSQSLIDLLSFMLQNLYEQREFVIILFKVAPLQLGTWLQARGLTGMYMYKFATKKSDLQWLTEKVKNKQAWKGIKILKNHHEIEDS